MSRTPSSQLLLKGVLSVGFVALSAAVIGAYTTPAQEFEISIYTGTPLSFWIGFVLALLIGTGTALLARSTGLRGLALGLGGGSMLAYVSLPLLRNYYFIASADTMSHLGWVRDIATGTIEPGALIYPGIHVLAVLITELSNFGLPRSLMFVTVLFPLLYFCFVGFSVRLFTGSGLGTVIGVTSAFLLLPINVIVTKLFAHPISQATLYMSLVLFMLFWYLTADGDRISERIPVTGIGALFLLTLTALVLYHPLAAAFTLLIFLTIAAVQCLFRRGFDSESLQTARPLYAPTLFLAVWLGIWMVVAHPGLSGQLMRIGARIVEFFQGGSAAGAVVAQRQSSLQGVGASLWGIFAKLFLVGLVYALLTVGFMLWSFLGRFENQCPEERNTVRLVTAGLIVVFPWALLQFVGDISSLFFRYVGLMMVVGTIFGAITIYYLVTDPRQLTGDLRLPRWFPRLRTVRSYSKTGLFVIFAVTLVFTAAFNFPSPQLYLASGHTTEADLDGHSTIFDLGDPGYELASIGYGVPRYRDAIEGRSGTDDGNWSRVPTPQYNHDLVGYVTNGSVEGGRYLILSDRMRLRRVVAYRGLRYDRSDFRAVESTRGVDRVFDNGDVRLYLYAER